MRMTRKMTIYGSGGGESVAISLTKKQYTNREMNASLLYDGTTGHANRETYHLALIFKAPKAMSQVTLKITGTHKNYQSGVAYRCQVAASMPENNATSGTVFYTPKAEGGSVNATVTLRQSFTAGASYTVWLFSSGNATGGYDYINRISVTMEGA